MIRCPATRSREATTTSTSGGFCINSKSMTAAVMAAANGMYFFMIIYAS